MMSNDQMEVMDKFLSTLRTARQHMSSLSLFSKEEKELQPLFREAEQIKSRANYH